MMYYVGSMMMWSVIFAGLVLASLLVAFVVLLFDGLTWLRLQRRKHAEGLAEAVPVEEPRFLTRL